MASWSDSGCSNVECNAVMAAAGAGDWADSALRTLAAY